MHLSNDNCEYDLALLEQRAGVRAFRKQISRFGRVNRRADVPVDVPVRSDVKPQGHHEKPRHPASPKGCRRARLPARVRSLTQLYDGNQNVEGSDS